MESKYRLSDFSSLSVICDVDKFIRSVETMNETVMVPSRLLNIEPPEKADDLPFLLRGTSDPHTFYTILNDVKNSLLFGVTDNSEVGKLVNDNSPWFVQCSNGKICKEAPKKEETKGHMRRISSVSTASVGSSEQECERLSDAGDSGVDTEETVEPALEVTSQLRTHILGLHGCLSTLTETATYVTKIYQKEVLE